jgi:hypothetical protein
MTIITEVIREEQAFDLHATRLNKESGNTTRGQLKAPK